MTPDQRLTITPDEYRDELLKHAERIGWQSSGVKGQLWSFSAGEFSTFVPYEPEGGARRALTNAKIALTNSMRAYYPEKLPPSKPHQEYRPSKNTKDNWLHSWPTERVLTDNEAGKWMMFMSRQYVDDTWKNVKAGTKRGELGCYAKVSTARQLGRVHVLSVYIEDYRNREEAVKLRERLRTMGFNRKIYFKRDSMTEAGISGSEFGA